MVKLITSKENSSLKTDGLKVSKPKLKRLTLNHRLHPVYQEAKYLYETGVIDFLKHSNHTHCKHLVISEFYGETKP